MIVSGPRVAHDALVLGSGESLHQTSITATLHASETAIQSEIPSETVWHLDTTQNHLNHSLSR